VCLPLLISRCTIKSRSSLLTLAHPGDPGKRAVKQLWCGVVVVSVDERYRDGAGNTVEENSSIFSLIRMHQLPSVL